MKPQDLRIGCYVKLRDSGEIVRVCGLTKHKVGFHAPNERPNAHLRYRKFCEIEGVLIYDHWRKIYCPDLSYDDKREGYNWYSYRPFVLDCPLRYIHELQNLHFALTGEELKIEL